MALMGHECTEIDPGAPSTVEGPREARPGAKSAASIDRWPSPLAVSSLTTARLNFLYS
jgi:hypothetical protein